ncbi:MAG: hypothetical protein ABEI27_12935 [Halobellus sp.]|uniref:DUF7096 domain-containing protein n=1 Tax=Halobellus sp. TaxID=1979212 RepID=UPI0035D3DC41
MRAAPLTLAVLLLVSAVAGSVPAATPNSPSQQSARATPPDAGRTPAAVGSTPTLGDLAVSGAPTAQVSTPEEPPERLINVLAVPDSAATRSTLDTEYVELGSGLGFSSDVTDAHLRTESVIERIESAETRETRQQYLLQSVSEVEQRIVALRSRQRQVAAAYGQGELPPRQLLYELALIDAEARELEDRRSRLQSLAQSTSGFSISASRFGNIELELNTLTGPVRGYAAAVLRGEATSGRFFVQTGPNSITLAVIRDGTYVREVFRGPLRGETGDSFSLVEAVNVTEQAYPTVADLRLRDDTLGNPDSDSARVTIEHRRGRLVAFVDSGSKRVFQEYQYRPIDQVVTRSPTSAVRDAMNLTAYRTYPGGPVRLQLNSTETGEPIDAQITVGPAGGRSTVVGQTGPDGSLWTLAPSNRYQVTAIDGSSVVVLSVQPTSTPAVYGALNETNETGTATADTST